MKGVDLRQGQYVLWCSEYKESEARRAYVFTIKEDGVHIEGAYVQEMDMTEAVDVLVDAPQEFIEITKRCIEDVVFFNRRAVGKWTEFSTINPAPKEDEEFQKAKRATEKRRMAEGL